MEVTNIHIKKIVKKNQKKNQRNKTKKAAQIFQRRKLFCNPLNPISMFIRQKHVVGWPHPPPQLTIVFPRDGTSRCPFVPGQNNLKIFKKKTRFPVLEHHFSVLEHPFLFQNVLFCFRASFFCFRVRNIYQGP